MKTLLLLAVAVYIMVNHVFLLQQERRSTANAEVERNRLVRDAKLAEAEGRYEDMAVAMYSLVQTGVELSTEEQALFFVANKHVETDVMFTRRAIKSIEQKLDFASKELKKGNSAKALVAYEEAFDIAKKNLSASNRLTLTAALQISTFFFEILKSTQKACHVANEAYNDALSEVDMSARNKNWDKKSELIFRLLRVKMKSWGCEDVPGDRQKLKENVLRRFEKKLDVNLDDVVKEMLNKKFDAAINFFYEKESYGEILSDDEKLTMLEIFLHSLLNGLPTRELQLILRPFQSNVHN